MIAGLKPFPAYKDSLASWIGNVPSHWRIVPALAVYRQRHEKNSGMAENTILSLSYGRIVVKSAEKLHGLMPESFETYQIVEPGNIIIRTTDLQNDRTSLRIGHSRNRGIITSAYMCLETTELVENEFGYQFLNAFDLLKGIYGYGSGLRQNLDFRHIKRMPVLVPPKDEQRAVLRFLHHADLKIRRFIAAKQKLIKLLEEEKQTITNYLVTRGIDPNVKLKASGIEWLGDVPEHWEIALNQRIFKENIRPHNGKSETPLSLSQRDGLIATDEMKERSLKTSTYDNWKVVVPGDLVLNRFKAHLGVFFAATLRGIVSFHYGVYEPRRLMCTEYFEHLYHTAPYRTIYAGRSNGMTVGLQNLSNQNFYNVKSIIPPLDEQLAIVERINSTTADLRKTISQTVREIELMRELRASLVSDVVTGKIDVREAAEKLPEINAESVPLDEIDDVPQDEETAEQDKLEADDAA